MANARKTKPQTGAHYGAVEPSAIVPLRHPFSLGGEDYSVVSLRPPAFDAVEEVIAGEMSEQEMHAAMAGIAPGVLQKLRWPDAELVTVIARHLAPDLAPGMAPSEKSAG